MYTKVWRMVVKCMDCGVYHPIGSDCKCTDKVTEPVVEEQEFLREE